MRTILTVLITILLTLILVLEASLGLSALDAQEPSLETVPATVPTTEATVPETTLPPETVPETEPVKTTIDTVPRYYQTDYPFIKFSSDTIATSGCSITCLAMVATYLTDTEYFPDQMAYHFGAYNGDNVERLINGNEQMQLPNVRANNVRDALKALEEGKVVIAMMREGSHFTTTAHFIVLAGLTEDGKIIVNDPLEEINARDTYMIEGYKNGFNDYDIIKGFSGAWIYDKSAMPEEPFLYDASMPEQAPTRYEGYYLSEEDIYLIASFLWAEARNESQEVQQAIAEVILNRLVSRDFPNTVRAVIYKGEYSANTKLMPYAEVEMPQYLAVNAAMFGPYQLPVNVYHFSKWEVQGEAWGEMGPYTFLYTKPEPTT